jgi:endogenous inhibitor of DNA gyrase (YacG/DUF329 family)
LENCDLSQSLFAEGHAKDQSGDKSAHSKFVFSPRLYFWLLPSYFCFMPKCPTCGKPVEWQDNSHRPFCSERCKLIDFSRWANGEYRVPGQRINPEAAEPNDPNQAVQNEESNGEQ